MPLLPAVIPGPGVLFVVGRAPAHGRRTAPTTVPGSTLDPYVLVVAVAFAAATARSWFTHPPGRLPAGPAARP